MANPDDSGLCQNTARTVAHAFGYLAYGQRGGSTAWTPLTISSKKAGKYMHTPQQHLTDPYGPPPDGLDRQRLMILGAVLVVLMLTLAVIVIVQHL